MNSNHAQNWYKQNSGIMKMTKSGKGSFNILSFTDFPPDVNGNKKGCYSSVCFPWDFWSLLLTDRMSGACKAMFTGEISILHIF